MDSSRQATKEGGGPTRESERARFAVAALLAAALIVLLLGDLIGGPTSEGSASESVVLPEGELVSRAGSIEPAPYWVGPRPEVDRFGVERDATGSLSIRYLPEGIADTDPGALRVSTYPVVAARDALRNASRSSGVPLFRRNGLVALAPPDGESAYVVFDNQPDLQIEVYEPRPGAAAEMVKEGDLVPLGWGVIE